MKSVTLQKCFSQSFPSKATIWHPLTARRPSAPRHWLGHPTQHHRALPSVESTRGCYSNIKTLGNFRLAKLLVWPSINFYDPWCKAGALSQKASCSLLKNAHQTNDETADGTRVWLVSFYTLPRRFSIYYISYSTGTLKSLGKATLLFAFPLRDTSMPTKLSVLIFEKISQESKCAPNSNAYLLIRNFVCTPLGIIICV